MANDEALVVFARQPDPNTTKTRLSPPLSREAAAELYACFLSDTLATARQAAGIRRCVAYDPPGAADYFAEAAPDFERRPQAGAGLGERMHECTSALFADGCARVVLIGSDLPHLQATVIEQGLAALRQGAEVVLGPTPDGGYYLVGLAGPQPSLFDVPMSTPTVWSETLERAQRLYLSLAQLPEEFDVDTWADVARLRARLAAEPSVTAHATRAWLAAWAAGGHA
jgi:rSAM/selenodomain-associated transferase 1